MIDCSRTENFLKEWKRLCGSYEDCTTCELNKCELNNVISGVCCNDLALQNPQKAIELVQKWSNEHPPKTLLTEFLKHYPKTELNSVGCPNIAPCELGIIKLKDECKYRNVYCFQCKDCWNTIVDDEDDEKD